ncbi:MAG: sortase [Ruminococcus sp.]|nr:sortase [Ruminococcus sp.]
MKNKIWKLFVIAGTMLILSALFLCLYNVWDSRRAGKRAEDILVQLKDEIPETHEYIQEPVLTPTDSEEDLFEQYSNETDEVKTISIDDRYYCGYIIIPKLGTELPVMDGWSYEGLKYSPCRYSGSVQDDDIVIAAHNYSSHFGNIRDLVQGDEVDFIDCSGTVHRYEVIYSEEIDGYNVEQMLRRQDGEWDMTLFTCTLSGQSRVTVRLERIKEKED